MKIFNVKRKRASLSLSLNAIVILVLAIAILGLGLTFIRGIFTGITAKVEEAVQAGEITNPPTRDRPVTITPPRVDVKVGQKAEVKIAFLNVLLDDTNDFGLEIYSSEADIGGANVLCTNTGSYTGLDCSVAMVYNPVEHVMDKDQINLWTVAVVPTTEALVTPPSDTYLYTAKLICGTSCGLDVKEYSRDFIVVVNS